MIRLTLIAISALLTTDPAFAQIVASQHVEKEEAYIDATGETKIRRIVAEKVAPGEEVIYSLRFRNTTDEDADALVLTMPVPKEIAYVEGSVAGAEAAVSFSVDGGQTYVPRGRLTIIEDGLERPAKGDEITHIKWTLANPLSPSEAGQVSYRGALR